MRKYRVLGVEHKTPDTFCLRVERPSSPILSGQCFNIGIPGLNINREYSMYSSADAPYLEFLIRAVNGGRVSSHLRGLNTGDLVELDGPYGEFCIPTDRRTARFLFICSGTGIAPFHSFVETFPRLDYLIVHGIRYASEAYDASHYQQGRYISCISKNSLGESMRVTDFLCKHPVKDDVFVYLCGNRHMIVDSVDILLNQGVNGSKIISEVFF